MKKIVIIGGGLVGSLLALSLKKNGYDVFLYEKRSNPQTGASERGRSINLIITSRGFHALKQVGLVEDVLKITSKVFGRMVHQVGGEINYQAYGRNNDECNYSVSRNELNNLLLRACENAGVNIYFNHELERLDFDKKIVFFKNGESTNYDVLFGADGAGSKVREFLKNSRAQYIESLDYLEVGYKELFMPKNSCLDTNALHIWPRGKYMLMGLPNLDASFTMTIYLPYKDSEKSFASIKTKSEALEFFQREFPDALELMPDATTHFLANPVGKLGTVKMSPWIYKDSVALIGDAAHAIVPFFGQGMNAGFEDITYLDRFLQNDNWQDALLKYDEFQRQNANAIADMALENFIEMSEKVGDQNFLARKKLEATLEKDFPTLYRSRYGMVTYTLIPYHLCQKAGVIQGQILSELLENSSYDKLKASELIKRKLIPFLGKYQLDISRYEV